MAGIEAELLQAVLVTYGIPGAVSVWLVMQTLKSRSDASTPSERWWSKLDALDEKMDDLRERVARIEGTLGVKHEP